MSLMIETTETPVCGVCQNAMPRENVRRRIDKRTGEHSMTAYCGVCDVVYVTTRQSHQTEWSQGVSIARGRERAAALAAIASLRGDVQLGDGNPAAAQRLLAQCAGPAPVEIGYGGGGRAEG